MSKQEKSFWSRHLDGWQAGVLLLVLAGSAVMLAVPRAVAPTELPPPNLDVAALNRSMAQDDELAREAVRTPLDAAVRVVGGAFRNYNLATANQQEQQLASAKRRLNKAVTAALHLGGEHLLRLRAYQLERFVAAAMEWRCTEAPSASLKELGGDFAVAAQRSEWCLPNSQLQLSERSLRVLFKQRWNQLTGLTGPTFALTLDEDRVRYAFLLKHPFVSHKQNALVHRQGKRRMLNRSRMKVIDRLARRDPSYPLHLARGVLFFRGGQAMQAAGAFRQHLSEHPDGPHTLYAQNYLKAALDAATTQ